jgi:DNA-binding GntR family transcriptional regulator
MLIRIGLEPIAAEASVKNATKSKILNIEKYFEQMKKLAKARNLSAYLDAHYKFHFGIYELANQEILLRAIEATWLRCGPTLNLALPEYNPGQKRHKHHLAALNALKQGNGKKLAQAIFADIESARGDIFHLLK